MLFFSLLTIYKEHNAPCKYQSASQNAITESELQDFYANVSPYTDRKHVFLIRIALLL